MASTISAGTTTTTSLVYTADTSGVLQLQTNGTTTAVTIDTSQNVGIQTTPSAWSANRPAIELGGSVQGAIAFNGNNSNGGLITYNSYYNGSATVYKNTGYACNYIIGTSSGSHVWTVAPSGSAGANVSSTTAMLLDNSGNLTISGATATKATGTVWANPSDTRLKNNQALYTKGLTELNQIKVKTWVYNGLGGSVNGQAGIGVIADEAMTILPDTVDTYSAKLNPTDTEETDIKRFNASEVIWLLVTSLQELDAKFESYKATHP